MVNVRRNPFISRDNVNPLHFVGLNPPFGQICYKDVLSLSSFFQCVLVYVDSSCLVSVGEQGVCRVHQLPFSSAVLQKHTF